MRAVQRILLVLLIEGGLGLIACGIGWAVGRPPWRLVRVDAGALAIGVAATVPMVAALVAAVHLPLRRLNRLFRLVRKMVVDLFEGISRAELAFVSLTAGVGEELLFRGLIQQAVADRFGTAVGLALASVLFGLVHPINGTYVVLATLAGAYFGWLLIATDNLLVPIVAHAMYDFAALVYLLPRGGSPR